MKIQKKIKNFYTEMKPEYHPIFGFIGIFFGMSILGAILGASMEKTAELALLLCILYGFRVFRKYKTKKKKK